MAKPTGTLPLNVFVARMDESEAELARNAAEEIDTLNREVRHLNDVELGYLPYAKWSAVAFVIGASAALIRVEPIKVIYDVIGPMGAILLMAFLPGVGLFYALQVRHRTAADLKILELNRQYFAPYGGYYFPAENGIGGGRVVEIDEPKPYFRRYSRYDYVRPGRLW